LNAVQIHRHGGTEVLRYGQTEDPALTAPTDVIVRLKAAAVNRIDIEMRRGSNRWQCCLPHILGSDGAGTIAAIGSPVSQFKVGDPVCLYPFTGCGRCQRCTREGEELCAKRQIFGQRESGTYAEYIKVPAKNCFAIPAGFSFEEAAAFPLVYTTTWRLLISQGKIKPGESVLIRGVGGGIATAALQIAASVGAHILVSSPSDEKLVKAKPFGVEHGINERISDLAKETRRLTGKRGVDLVIDGIGGDGWVKSLACLARGGRLVTCGAVAGAHPTTDLRRVFWNNLKIFGTNQGTREEFHQLLNFFERSGTRPMIDTVYPLKEAARAHQRMEERRQFGKIVLRTDA
jgi:NADPH:quinone reductase-like Zn-dependent oxidoreductase